jgi:hypothetical protein
MPEARIDAQLRREVEDAAEGRCEYCRSPERFAVQAFAVDHIVPKSKGGESTFGNLALSCPGCNGHKYNRTEALDPVSDKAAPLHHPRREAWGDHFSWTADYAHIVGLTPTGRATVEALHLNRDGVVRLRRVLRAAGEHPPIERSAPPRRL